MSAGLPWNDSKAQSTAKVAYDRFTLLDRGDFYDGWSIDYRDDEFFIQSTDRKIVYLVKRYGDDIFGLTDQNIDRLIDFIRDEFIKESRDKILKQ